ncbi:MAG: hypothetical protein MJZ50_09390 [Treponema sp.]|nr:hypothetical protein [Treponema sp.]
MALFETKDGNSYFDTNMAPEVFARTGYTAHIREKGVLGELKDGKWILSPWSFIETFEKDEKLYLKGPAFDGSSLESIFETDDKNQGLHESCLAAISVLEAGLKEKAPCSCIGAGGILVSHDRTQVLILPRKLFTAAVSKLTQDEFNLAQGYYTNPVFLGEDAVRFTQAVIAYRLLSGKFPFPEAETNRRTLDVIDRNFVPLEYESAIPAAPVADFTDKAFSKKKCQFPFKTLESISPAELCQRKADGSLRDSAAGGRRKRFMKLRAKRVAAKRFIRRNKIGLAICGLVGILMGLASSSLYRTAMDKATTKGLTAFDTVKMYYSAVNTMDADAASRCLSKELKFHADHLSQITATYKTRAAYNMDFETVFPAVWLVKNNVYHYIYGLSNFCIEGTNTESIFEGPAKKTKPQVVTNADGTVPEDGSKATFTVDYYIWDTIGEDSINVSKKRDLVTLTFIEDKWIITGIESTEDKRHFSFSEFKDGYIGCTTDDSRLPEEILHARSVLSQKYDFMPTEYEIMQAYEYLKRKSFYVFKEE